MITGGDWEFGDPCVDRGEETSADHRRYCDACYAEQRAWRSRHPDPEPRRAERPAPGTVDGISIAAIVDIRRELAHLRRRIEQLEVQR